FESYLKERLDKLNCNYEPISSAVKYALDGGKRIRPILCILGAEFMGQSFESVKDLALGVECIHNYSLCHDDLPCMDNDDLRHGKPSTHKKFGEGMGVLAGDALLNLAFEFMLDGDRSLEYYKAVRYISEMSGIFGMVGGQCIDIAQDEFREKSLDEIILLNMLKTSCLFKAALVGSSMSLGASLDEIASLEIYAQKIGLIFQIVDDILDVTSNSEVLGKNINSDLKANKTTYLSICGMEKAKQDINNLEIEAISAVAKYGDRANNLIKLAKYLTNRSK
ncbi:MAG: polyprenyl synthetase family protein, partial [Clostridia bacterium]|nr:polyprenyl synthetase family protein [Clostridia bacterium]